MRTEILRCRGGAWRRALVPRPVWPRMAAFTLIELIVVIAIISLLITLVLPGLTAARSSAFNTICQSNMKQLFVGTYAHTQDYEDRLPYFGFMTGQAGYPKASWWAEQVGDAMGVLEAGIFKCPADLKRTKVTLRPRLRSGGRRIRVDMSYRSSCDLVEPVKNQTSLYVARKITSWKKPARALMLVEGMKNDVTTPERECVRWKDDLGNFGATGFGSKQLRHVFLYSWKRHFDLSNFLFIDGHLEALAPDKNLANLANTQEFYLP